MASLALLALLAAAGCDERDPSRTDGVDVDHGIRDAAAPVDDADPADAEAPAPDAAPDAGLERDAAPEPDAASAPEPDCEGRFAVTVQPRLTLCRTCHVPDGIADVAEGQRFQLDPDGDDDYGHVHAAWQRLGEDDRGISPLLAMPSGTAERVHTGGAPWPVDGDAYRDMAAAIEGFVDPSACVGDPMVEVPPPLPLLGSSHGGHLWADHCEGEPDASPLPPDPRWLIAPGVNAGRAVVFDAWWRDCGNRRAAPTTCGEYRALRDEGWLVGAGQGQPGTATMFSGSAHETLFSVPSRIYNRLWLTWGLLARPAQYDLLVAERFGSPLAPERNPYPLIGEDPNRTDGGSGQLPLAFTQLREPDGRWTGRIGVKLCSFCHNGAIGSRDDGPDLGAVFGGVGTMGDFEVAFRDFALAGAPQFAPFSGLANIASNRGTGAIDQFQLGFVVFSGGDLEQLNNPKIVFSQAIGTIKSPAWWNLGHRPQKFHGGVLHTDSSRIDMAAYYPILDPPQDALDWVDEKSVPFQIWAESLRAPVYPGAIDTKLAEQGAALFHAKDLWAPHLDNPVPRPDAGNGSCASCHGAYSPRYVHDPAFLEDPALAGIAARAVPLSIIDSDPVYAEAIESLKDEDGSVPEVILRNAFLYCEMGVSTRDQTPVMLAPPLHGVWAAAPYMHNGSVPDVWSVLSDPAERPDIWRRVSTPAPGGLEGRVVMGYDTDLGRAYDHTRLGWRYDRLACGDDGTDPWLSCNPARPDLDRPSLLQQIFSAVYEDIALLWSLPLPQDLIVDDAAVERRKIYNTHLYSQGNGGHAFTTVLTDTERRAIVEYLKTL